VVVGVDDDRHAVRLAEPPRRREAAREAEKRGVKVTDQLVEEMRHTLTPPREIDFRMS